MIRNTPEWENVISEVDGQERTDREFPEDPVEFSKEILGITLWGGQRDVAYSVRDRRHTVVEAGHSVGKSVVAACLIMWWLCKCWQKGETGIAIVVAPTWSQVQNVIFRYVRTIGRRANLPGEILETPRWKITSGLYAFGLSPRKATKEDIASLQGYHDPNLLVIMDEAAGLPRILWDGVNTLATAPSNRTLAIGNPIGQSGPFWDACTSETWSRININCLDHPNVRDNSDEIPGAVSYGWVIDMIRDHCVVVERNSPGAFLFNDTYYLPDHVFTARVLGQAPGESDDQLIPLEWIRWANMNTVKPRGRTVIGFDPSRSTSGDQAVMIARTGGKLLWIKRRRPVSTKNPSAELAGWVYEEWRELNADAVYIDEGGPGGGVVDGAREMGVPVFGIYSQGSPTQKKRFHNLRAQMYWRLREALQSELMEMPEDDLLEGDLVAVKYTWDATGRYLLEPKEDIRDRLNRSPDSGDALALTFAFDGLTDEDVVRNADDKKSSSLATPSKWYMATKNVQRPVSRWRKFSR